MNLGLVENFVTTLREGNKEAFITGEDGLRAVEVALAAYQAAKKHEPVRIR
jgi:UDP-N-acetylglucosamine 3-dehydrogenase